MNTRRRWTAAVAAALAVVLAGGVASAATMGTDRAPAPAAAVPVAAVPTDPPFHPAAVAAAPAPAAPAPPTGHCAAPTPYATCLGPPPGAQADAAPARTAAPADRWALLVGVTRYPAPTHDTIAGADDAVAIRDLLLADGWLPDHVRVLTDGAATGAAVREGLAWLAQHSTPGTFALFHFSGHVKQLGGGTEALWTVDRDWVRDVDLTRSLQPAQGHLWVDVAGCEAGSFFPGLPSDRVLVTGSSRDVEKSYEHPDWHASVWVGLLYQQGMAQRQADADGDGRVTVGEAIRYATYYAQVVTWLQEPYGRQTPQSAGDPVQGWTLADPPA